MIASLPMYWRDETAEAWRGFWARVRQASAEELPDLTAPDDLPGDWTDHWLSSDLALSMTCGLPLRTRLKGKVTYVGTLDFALGGPPGYYHSQIVMRPGLPSDAHGLRLAYNDAYSQSGWAAAAELGHGIGGWIETGGHAQSLKTVARGDADIALIDAVTWRLLQQRDADAQNVVPTGQTSPTPGLPLICALGRDPEPLRAALRDAVERSGPEERAALGGVAGFVVLRDALYHDLPVPAPPPA